MSDGRGKSAKPRDPHRDRDGDAGEEPSRRGGLWLALAREVELDGVDGVGLRVDEEHPVDVERAAVLEHLTARGRAVDARRDTARLHLGDVAAGVVLNDVVCT